MGLLMIFILYLNVPMEHTIKIIKMEMNNLLPSSIVPSTTLMGVPSTTLRHQEPLRWLSGAETTDDEESAEILNSILELI